MNNDANRQRAEYAISDVETLKVFSDPLRLRILRTVTAQPRAVKEVAHELGLRPTKLYYHFNLLEAHGLIYVAETRMVGHLIEKLYQSTARRFTVQRDHVALREPLSTQDVNEGLSAVIGLFISDTDQAIRNGVAAGLIDPLQHTPHPQALLLRAMRLQLSSEQAEQFVLRIRALIDELRAIQRTPPPDAQWYAFSFAVGQTTPPLPALEAS